MIVFYAFRLINCYFVCLHNEFHRRDERFVTRARYAIPAFVSWSSA